MTHSASFGIQSPREYLQELIIPQYEEFISNPLSPRLALLTIFLLYHMYEWVHHHRYSVRHFRRVYPDDLDLIPYFLLAEKITNGSKHFRSKVKTRRKGGFSREFSEEFDLAALMAELDCRREVTADTLIEQLVDFWQRWEKREFT